MQSKTSCCNKAVIRKDITRFAPVWGLYILCLLMGIFLMAGPEERAYVFPRDLMNLPQVMALVNCGYALLVAQLLFGDLYSARSCYALHAMPLRRETWFLSHIVSGLIFSLVPTALMCLFAEFLMAGSAVAGGWMMPLYVFAASNLQYLFFFGLATLCAFAAGNRLGMLACYGVVNFLAEAVSMVVVRLYMPMLFGVVYDDTVLQPFFPMGRLMDCDMLDLPQYSELVSAWDQAEKAYDLQLTFTLGDGWGYTLLMAAIGIVLLALALVLYRRRKLECAGDLLAVKFLEPVFLVLAALACGFAFQMVFSDIRGIQYMDLSAQQPAVQYMKANCWMAFLLVGMTVGWFGGKMLLARTTRVFRKKAVPGLVVLMAVTALSFAGAAMDPLGIETRQPAPGEIESVAFSGDAYWSAVKMEQPGDREKLMELHTLAMTDRVYRGDVHNNPEDRDYDLFTVTYNLKNGRTVRRCYLFWVDSPTGQLARTFYTRPEVVLSGYNGDFDPTDIQRLNIWGGRSGMFFRDRADIDSFLAAVQADCAAGTMAGNYAYHRNTGYFGRPGDENVYEASIRVELETRHDYGGVNVYPDSENTLKWLEDRGALEELGYTLMEGDYYDYAEYIRAQNDDGYVG